METPVAFAAITHAQHARIPPGRVRGFGRRGVQRLMPNTFSRRAQARPTGRARLPQLRGATEACGRCWRLASGSFLPGRSVTMGGSIEARHHARVTRPGGGREVHSAGGAGNAAGLRALTER